MHYTRGARARPRGDQPSQPSRERQLAARGRRSEQGERRAHPLPAARWRSMRHGASRQALCCSIGASGGRGRGIEGSPIGAKMQKIYIPFTVLFVAIRSPFKLHSNSTQSEFLSC